MDVSMAGVSDSPLTQGAVATHHIAAQRGCAHKAVGAVVYPYGVVCRFTPQTARGQKFIASLSHEIQRQRHVAQFKSA